MPSRPFSLSPDDRATTGIRVDPAGLKLVIRPTAPSIAIGIVYITVGLLGIGAATALHRGVWIAAAPVGLLAAVAGWRLATARLVAGSDTLTIRNHWRTRRLQWSEVRSMQERVVDERWGRLPLASWPTSQQINEVVLVTDIGAVVPDALSSFHGREVGDRSATTVKLAVLRRWCDEVAAG